MTTSSILFEQAQQVIPGGVNSPVRAFKGVGGSPVFFKSAAGAYLTDSEDKTYIDYVGSWGPMILGHSHTKVVEAVIQQAKIGLSFGAPTEIEIRMAREVCKILPSIEKIRMVSSGTEATMSAIRLARGYTGKDKIIKFEGCYHGHADSLLVKAGSGALTLGVPNSPGVPASIAEQTLTLTYNDLDAVKQCLEKYSQDVAAIIVEPIAGNMNFIRPVAGFLEGLRALCDEHKVVLIFDEVMTGFRVGLKGVQGLHNISPDLTTLGKIIGAGMPVGAFGGKKEIMNCIAPDGPVYQAGTLSGNPVAMAAGLAMLEEIQKDGFYDRLYANTKKLCDGLQAVADKHNIPFSTDCEGGMFGFFFNAHKKVTSFAQVMETNQERFKTFYHAMLAKGIYLAPSSFEAGFVSAAHTAEDINATLHAADEVMATL